VCSVPMASVRQHCPMCQVCISKRSHHNPVVGCCIGRGNQGAFTALALLVAAHGFAGGCAFWLHGGSYLWQTGSLSMEQAALLLCCVGAPGMAEFILGFTVCVSIQFREPLVLQYVAEWPILVAVVRFIADADQPAPVVLGGKNSDLWNKNVNDPVHAALDSMGPSSINSMGPSSEEDQLHAAGPGQICVAPMPIEG